VVRYMASGGFGNTYEIEHVKLHKRLALKEFFMHGINQREGLSVTVNQEENRPAFDQMREKFLHEAQRLASLEELHIVEVSDFFEENQTAYYVMKLIDGTSLSAMMKRQSRPFTEDEVRRLLPQVLSALKYVHTRDLYHLDLKPGNIMMNGEGHCWLIDFGASKQMSAKESQTLSTSTGLCYTPGFAPVEQMNQNTKRIGPWTDLYALGATLYNLLTNQAPPNTDDIIDEGSSAFAFPAAVSAEMRQLIVQLMKQSSKERPQSVEEVEQILMNRDNYDAETTLFESQSTSKPQTNAPASPNVSVDTVLHRPEGVDREVDSVLQNLIDNMVYVEGGTFQMGSNDGKSDERPVHSVTLSPFYMGRYEVTQEEWKTVMGTNPSSFWGFIRFKGAKRPVENVSWNDCQEFIRRLNKMTGMTFRLPTEAEWEYAARGGNRHDDYKYAGSNDIDTVAVYADNNDGKTNDVGTKHPNGLGLYDMSGNVWEWCQDWYDDYYYKSPQQDPCNETEDILRVCRGGSWYNYAGRCRVSFRGSNSPDFRSGYLGLRLAR